MGSYVEDPKSTGMMAQVCAHLHDGELLSITCTCWINIVVTPSHRFTHVNKVVDPGVNIEMGYFDVISLSRHPKWRKKNINWTQGVEVILAKKRCGSRDEGYPWNCLG